MFYVGILRLFGVLGLMSFECGYAVLGYFAGVLSFLVFVGVSYSWI